MYEPIFQFQGHSIVGFEWDDANRDKCQKHGVSIEMVEALFRREIDIRPDLAHSQSEQRFLAVGTGRAGRPVFLVFTVRTAREGAMIRPISARYMHRKEMERYEKTAPGSDD